MISLEAGPFFLALSEGSDIVTIVEMTVEKLNFTRRSCVFLFQGFRRFGCAHKTITGETDRMKPISLF